MILGAAAVAYGKGAPYASCGGLTSSASWLNVPNDAIALAIVVVGIAYLTLVLGELVPKRLALPSPERIAAAVAAPMRLLSRMAAPAVHLLSISTAAVLRVSGIRPSVEPLATEEEIIVLIEQGTQAGMFEKAESNMIESIFRLGDRRVDALMTPQQRLSGSTSMTLHNKGAPKWSLSALHSWCTSPRRG